MGYGYSSSSWQGINTRFAGLNGKVFTEVSVKQLKTILKSERTKREVEDLLGELESQKHEVPNIEFELTPDDYKNNTWYKSKESNNIFFLEKGKKNYGFYPEYSDTIEWFKNFRENGFHIKGQWTEATEQELLEAFTKEANKRFKVGDRIASPGGHDYGYKVYNTNYKFIRGLMNENIFGFLEGTVVTTNLFHNGVWATVVDPFAELKEAHKNGAIIQFREKSSPFWIDVACNKPSWVEGTEYRIKPLEEKPKVGDVCKFWNYDERNFEVATLVRVYSEKETYRYASAASSWINAKSITQQQAITLLFKK